MCVFVCIVFFMCIYVQNIQCTVCTKHAKVSSILYIYIYIYIYILYIIYNIYIYIIYNI